VAAREDLAGGESHGAWGDWPTQEATGAPQAAWLETGRKTGVVSVARGHRRRGRGGVGAAAVLAT
jgi:hypothetical protein